MSKGMFELVLNLVINGLPSILEKSQKVWEDFHEVLNLVINGLPSIQYNSVT